MSSSTCSSMDRISDFGSEDEGSSPSGCTLNKCLLKKRCSLHHKIAYPMANSFWIILASFLAATNAGLLGNFLILRKQAMIGDAISHAVLPGLALAFMVSNTTHPVVFFIGAALAGMGATLLISFFEHKIGIEADVAIGVTFTAFFALGVLLVTLFTQKADLDQQCVLYGEPMLVPFDIWFYGDYRMGPQAIYVLGLLLLCNLLFIVICYRPLVVTSFDPNFATVLGINKGYWHYLLMLFTALTTVAAFKVVGAVLVMALLVIPSATAYLLSGQLKTMIFYTVVIDIWITILGFHTATWLNASIAGAIVSVGALFFMIALGMHIITQRR